MHFLCIQVIIIRHEESSGEGLIMGTEEPCEQFWAVQFDKNLQCKKKKKKPKKEIVRKNNKYKPLNYDKRLHYDFIPR